MQGWMLSAHHIMIDRTFPDDLACSSYKNTWAGMNNSGYDELNKKYQDLLEENKYLKARIEKLEAEPHSLESDPKAFQDQKKEEKGTGEMPTIDTSWALFFSLQRVRV